MSSIPPEGQDLSKEVVQGTTDISALPSFGRFTPVQALDVICRDLSERPAVFGVHSHLVLGNDSRVAGGHNPKSAFWAGYYSGAVGSYIVIHPYDADHIRAAISTHGPRNVAAVHKGLQDVGIPMLWVCPWEADDGSLNDQWDSILGHESETGVDVPLAVLSGDTREASIQATGLTPNRVLPGKSIHAWVTVQPVRATEANIEKRKTIQQMHVGLHGSDPAIVNRGRLMRTPGVVAGGAWGEGDLHRIQTIIRCQDTGPGPTMDEYLEALAGAWKKRNYAPVSEVFEAVQIADRLLRLGKKTPLSLGGDEILEHGRHVLLHRGEGLSDSDRSLAKAILDVGVKDRPPARRKGSTRPRPPTPGRTSSSVLEWDTPVEALGGEVHTLRDWAGIVPTRPQGKAPCRCPAPTHDDSTPSAVLFTTAAGTPFVSCSSCGTFWPPRGGGALPSPFSAGRKKPAASPYLGKLNLVSPVTVVHGDTGTRKTTRLAEILDQHERVLVIVHRRSLALTLAYRFGIACYLDLPDGPIHEGKVVVCLDSITRIPLEGDGDLLADGVQGWDLVIIEESESVLEHLTGGTIPKEVKSGRATSGEVHDHLTALLRATVTGGGKVVTTDGLTTNFTTRSMMAMTAVEPYDIDLVQHFVQLEDHRLLEYEHLADIVFAIIEAVVAGKRVVVACTSAALVRRLEIHFSGQIRVDGHPLRVRAYHREMDDDARVELRDVNASWCDVDVLLYSPSVDTGVSYDPAVDDRFDEMFVVGVRVPGLGVGKLLQMRHRCREMKAIHWWIPASYGHRMPLDEELIRREMTARFMHTRAFARRYVEKDGRVVPEIADGGHFDHAVRAELHRRRGWAQVREDWVSWWSDKDAVLESSPALDREARKVMSTLLQDLKEEESDAHAKAVVAAARLFLDEFLRLRKRGPRTRDEAFSLERSRLLDQFSDVDHELARDDRHRKVSRSTRRVVLAGLLLDRAMEQATEEDQGTLATGYPAHCRGETARVALLLGLLRAGLGREILLGLFEPVMAPRCPNSGVGRAS